MASTAIVKKETGKKGYQDIDLGELAFPVDQPKGLTPVQRALVDWRNLADNSGHSTPTATRVLVLRMLAYGLEYAGGFDSSIVEHINERAEKATADPNVSLAIVLQRLRSVNARSVQLVIDACYNLMCTVKGPKLDRGKRIWDRAFSAFDQAHAPAEGMPGWKLGVLISNALTGQPLPA